MVPTDMSGSYDTHTQHINPVDLQRAGPRPPLLFPVLRRWNPRISAAKAMSLADNFLQKQQKQLGEDAARGGPLR
jgi:hypothetical protein